MKTAFSYVAVIGLSTLLLLGCCDGSSDDCEAGLTVVIQYDPRSDIKNMTVRWSSKKGNETGKAVYRPKENRFFIAETSDVLGDEIDIDVVLDKVVISQETYPIKWQKTACGKAQGASWCDDVTYELANIDIDLREEEEQ